MSILKRLEEIRLQKRLNKGQFEKIIGKSSGYIGTLMKTGSIPGVDVIINVSKNFPEINLNWLLTGEGEMLSVKEEQVSDDGEEYAAGEKKQILEELESMKTEMQENFEAINSALVQLLKGDNKLQRFVEGLGEARIQDTVKRLQEYLKDKQER